MAIIINPLCRKWVKWIRVAKLKWEIRRSQKFKSKCEELRCFNLAGLEEEYRQEIEVKIKELERDR